MSGDGLGLSPAQNTAVLARIVDERGIDGDFYSRGGVVEELEHRMAETLGKERAVFFPTGTLANHVAVRALAGARTRVVVPHDSHLYNDSGDCAQQLSQLNLIPLASDSATFRLSQVEEIVERTRSGRVETGVGALVIESPVRRRFGEMFDPSEAARICDYAKSVGIGTHLDGARLYMACAYTGNTPKEMAAGFDTVYVSLWKYFNAASGAILAGPRALMDPLYHMRRMFGGGLPGAWPFAAVALYFLSSFEDEFARAVQTSRELYQALDKHDGFRVVPIENGTNLTILEVRAPDLERFRSNLRSRGIALPSPRDALGGFLLGVNATWNRQSAAAMASAFQESIEEA